MFTLLLALSCTDYNIHKQPEGRGGSDTSAIPDTGDTAPAVDLCDDLSSPSPGPVALNEECDVGLQTGTFTPVVEWKWGNQTFCGPPAVGQIIDTNGSGAIDDGDMPVVLIYQNNKAVALYGDGSGPAWTSSSSNQGRDGGFAIGDVNSDGWPDVVTAANSSVCALDGRDGRQLWCRTGLKHSMDPLGYNYPSVADMDGDGNVEVVIGNTILRGADGSIRGQGNRGIGAAPYGGTGTSYYGAISAVTDLDGDGVQEVVVGNAAYDPDGNTIWANSGPDGLVAIADFDMDGEGEIVKTSGVYVYGLETDGSTAWGPKTYVGNLGAPAIDDLNGDGVPEFVFAAQEKLIAMRWGGTEMWRADISDMSGAAGPTLFDFEMDGYPEVLYADEVSIRFFSGLDGSVKYYSDKHSSYTILETPVVADVDGDGQVEIALGHCTGNGQYGAVTVYGDADQSWPPGRKIWNQHTYHITNIDDHGGVPSGYQQNWPTYNSFRSGDVGRPPGEYWDLRSEILDICEDECDSGGTVLVGAWVLNAGNQDVPAGVPVSLRAGPGGPVLDVATVPSAIPSGTTSEMVVLRAAAADIAGTRPVVTADEDSSGLGSIFECDETNNGETWSSAVCQ